MQLRKLHMILCATLLASACADIESVSQESKAIVGGNIEPGFSATALIEVTFPTDDGSMPDDEPYVCTGVWFDTTPEGDALILTAASCVWPNHDAETDINPMSGPGYSGLEIHFGSGAGANPLTVKSVVPHRYYDGEENLSDNIAIVILDGGPATGEPASLATGALNVVPDTTEVTLVGYGLQDPTNATSWGAKRSLTTPVRQVEPNGILAGTDEATTCVGDNGGPVYQLIEGEQKVIAINSRHSRQDPCDNQVRRLRIDQYYEDFIGAYVDCTINDNAACDACDYDGVCTEDCPTRDWDCDLGMFTGEACALNGECEEGGRCIPALDDDSFTYCAKQCDPSLEGGCPTGMTCMDDGNGGNECAWSTPSPGSQGFSCERFGDAECRSGMCEDFICVFECDPSDANSCAAPYICGEARGKNVCLGEDLSGGGGFCQAGGLTEGSRAPWFFMTFMALLAFAATRKRRMS